MKKQHVGQNLVILFFLFLLKIESVGPADQQINLVSPNASEPWLTKIKDLEKKLKKIILFWLNLRLRKFLKISKIIC